jgi:hypothetical protein
MVYDENSIKQIKELVNAILDLGNCKERFDDLFECEITFNRERLLEEYPEYENLTNEELLQKAYEYDDENSYEGYPVVDGYIITAKDIKDELLAKKLSKIDKIFDTYASYC